MIDYALTWMWIFLAGYYTYKADYSMAINCLQMFALTMILKRVEQ
jgi:hypothetical protein